MLFWFLSKSIAFSAAEYIRTPSKMPQRKRELPKNQEWRCPTSTNFLDLPAELQVKIFRDYLNWSYDIHVTRNSKAHAMLLSAPVDCSRPCIYCAASVTPPSKYKTNTTRVFYMNRAEKNEYNMIWCNGLGSKSDEFLILRLSRKVYPQARQALVDCFSGNVFVSHHFVEQIEAGQESEWYDELIRAAGVPGEKITTLTLETGTLWQRNAIPNLRDWNAFGTFLDFTKLPNLKKVNLTLPFFGHPFPDRHEKKCVTHKDDKPTGEDMLGDRFDRRIIEFATTKLPWNVSKNTHEIRSPKGKVVEVGLFGRLRNEPLIPFTCEGLDDLFDSRPDVVSQSPLSFVFLSLVESLN